MLKLLYTIMNIFINTMRKSRQFLLKIFTCMNFKVSIQGKKFLIILLNYIYIHIICYINNIKNCECLPCEIGTGIFITKNITDFKSLFKESTTHIFIPIYFNNHFTFVYINMDEKFIYRPCEIK